MLLNKIKSSIHKVKLSNTFACILLLIFSISVQCLFYTNHNQSLFLFYSLSGYSPFAGENDLDTFANITLGDFDFEDEVWNDISDDAKDFIQKLMLKDKSDRLTIDDALAHPWLNVRSMSIFFFLFLFSCCN